MIVNCEIIKQSSASSDSQDYDKLIIKIKFEKYINSNIINLISLFLNTLILGGARKLMVDMNNLDYIDSSGIGVFIGIAKSIRIQKGDIVFFDVPPVINDIFKVVKLPEYIKMFSSMDEAVRYFKSI